MTYNIAVIPGDGIGPEVTAEAVRVLNRAGEIFGHEFKYTELFAGGSAIDKFGEPLPQRTIDACRQSDSVLLGAVGGWQWDTLPGDKRPERALLGLRAELGLYANLRPARLHPALTDACPLRPDVAARGIDMIVVRELTGGIYFGERGRVQTDMGEAAWDTERYSYEEVRRIAVCAFKTAERRGRRVTNVDKANVLESSRLWREVVQETAAGFPGIALDHMYVDNASMQLIRDPGHFDVIVTTNMFGDILSDEASQITGSIGMLPSASLNGRSSPGGPEFGMYEPVHGSAPDLAGKDTANPIASVLSAAMMLRHSFALEEPAAAVEGAVTAVLDAGYRTSDIMSHNKIRVGTKKMGTLIIENLGMTKL
ncbi:MAG: 3-isopropylmalate dehydrogenase [Clostridiales bacterium]|jgi:3-isopropylmalate dehydrogenase|nr:3-isopropylmalate dehydrogenase [Clostridiales bacterium]